MEVSIAAEKIAAIGGFPLTNTLLMTALVSGVFVLASLNLFRPRRLALIPGGLQNTFETVVETLNGLLVSVFQTRERAERYFPFVATLFLLILISNWFGVFPFLGAIGIPLEHGEHAETSFRPLFRSSASDINFTLTLALIAITAVQWFGITAVGFFKHLQRYVNFRNPIDFFIGILELFSEVSKMISLSFRLFGNIFAGEVLLLIISFLVPFLAPVPFLVLELFVGFIQALVFALLTAIFIHITTTEHH